MSGKGIMKRDERYLSWVKEPNLRNLPQPAGDFGDFRIAQNYRMKLQKAKGKGRCVMSESNEFAIVTTGAMQELASRKPTSTWNGNWKSSNAFAFDRVPTGGWFR